MCDFKSVPLDQWDEAHYYRFLGLKKRFPFITRRPRIHQLAFVARYYAMYFSGDPKLNNVSPFCLGDGTGLGKTQEMAMLIAYQIWLVRKSPRTLVPVMEPSKPYFFKDEVVRCVKRRAWCSCHRSPAALTKSRKMPPAKPMAVVTEHAAMKQIKTELITLFCQSKVSIFHYRPNIGPWERYCNFQRLRDFTTRSAEGRREKVPVVLISWPALLTEHLNTEGVYLRSCSWRALPGD